MATQPIDRRQAEADLNGEILMRNTFWLTIVTFVGFIAAIVFTVL